jgi:hypothetical protein
MKMLLTLLLVLQLLVGMLPHVWQQHPPPAAGSPCWQAPLENVA